MNILLWSDEFSHNIFLIIKRLTKATMRPLVAKKNKKIKNGKIIATKPCMIVFVVTIKVKLRIHKPGKQNCSKIYNGKPFCDFNLR